MKKLVICGNYGATNIGDEAILDGLLRLVRNACPQAIITVLSSNPEETSRLHDVGSAYLLPAGIRSFFRGIFSGQIGKTLDIIKNCDGFILGGGGLFTDEKLMAIIIWSIQARFALLFKKPLFCIGQSIGPLRTFFARHMVKAIFKRALSVSVRDTLSQEVLHKLGLPRPDVLADPAFAVHLESDISEMKENFIVLSLRKWPASDIDMLYKSFAQLIEWIYSEYGLKTVLVPFQSLIVSDSVFMNNIIAHLKNRQNVELFEFNPDYKRVLELIGRSTAVIGMRLHSLIFSVLTQTPFLALSYSSKVSGLVNDLEMADYMLEWDKFDLSDLKKSFIKLMDNYEPVKKNLSEKNILIRIRAHEHEAKIALFAQLCGEREQN